MKVQGERLLEAIAVACTFSKGMENIRGDSWKAWKNGSASRSGGAACHVRATSRKYLRHMKNGVMRFTISLICRHVRGISFALNNGRNHWLAHFKLRSHFAETSRWWAKQKSVIFSTNSPLPPRRLRTLIMKLERTSRHKTRYLLLPFHPKINLALDLTGKPTLRASTNFHRPILPIKHNAVFFLLSALVH